MPVPILAAAVARYVATGLSRKEAIVKAKRAIKDYLEKDEKRNRYAKGSVEARRHAKKVAKKDQHDADVKHGKSTRELKKALGIKPKNVRLTDRQIAKQNKKEHKKAVKANVKAYKRNTKTAEERSKAKKGQLDLFKDHK